MTQHHLDEGAGDGDVPRSPSGGPFLASKLEVPPLPTFWVPRPRLNARLGRGVGGPLTALSAPAGSGKTLLAASWATSGAAPGPVVWLTLDEDDDDPDTFWFSVRQALHRAGVAMSWPSPGTSPTHARPGPADRSFLAGLAFGFAERSEPVVLVVDEFDTVTDRRITDAVDFVLRRSARGLRLVLLGRRDPLFPLHRYRLHDELTEIRAADLAFTRDETERLLEAHELSLPEKAVTALLERTQGWVVGVRLTALVLQSMQQADGEQFVAELTADESTIADYLVSEVLDAQPPRVRAMLLDASLVECVHPDLADALTGSADSAGMLTALERSDTFVSQVPSAPGWYRFHPLFRDVLRAQLAYERPDLVSELHLRAARWLAGHDLLDEAVTHAAAAGDWSVACSLVLDELALGSLLVRRRPGRIAEVLATMPADEPGAETAVVRAALALAEFDLDACDDALGRAEHALLRQRPLPRPSVRLAVSLVGSVLARLRGDALLAVAAARRARSLMRETAPSGAAGHPELDAILASTEGSALTWVGDLTGAERVLASALATPIALGDLALVESVRGNLQRAARHGREALAACADADGLVALHQAAAGNLALAWVALEEYDLDAARRYAEKVALTMAAGNDPLLAAGLALVRARLLRLEGAYGAALPVLTAAVRDVPEADVTWPPTWLARQIALTEASVRVAAGTPDEALALLEPLADDSVEYGVAAAAAWLEAGDAPRAHAMLRPALERADSADPLPSRVEGWLLEGRMLAEAGQPRRAAHAASEALRLAQPQRLRRPFAEEAAWLRHLLRHDAALADAHAWLGSQLVPHPRHPHALESAEPEGGEAVLVEPLSAREREVLALLAQMMSTEEIASALFLSHNTVKTHLKSIYRKLSASRRGEAVRRARRLGLLPHP